MITLDVYDEDVVAAWKRAVAIRVNAAKVAPKQTDSNFDNEFWGALAEVVVARYSGLPMRPVTRDFKKQAHLGDVGTLEIKATPHPRGNLLVKGRAADQRDCLLVKFGNFGEAKLMGWINVGKAKKIGVPFTQGKKPQPWNYNTVKVTPEQLNSMDSIDWEKYRE